MPPFFQRKETPPRRQVISLVFLSVVFGFGAGAVGMLFAAAYLTPEPQLLNLGGQPYARKAAVLPLKDAERIASPVETAARSLVLFYPTKAFERGRVAGREVFLPADAVGSGMILTSDGWLTTHAGVLTTRGVKSAADLSAVIGTRRYRISETVRDPFTDLLFVKIEAANLPVVSFGTGSDLAPGDPVFVFDAARGPRRNDVIGSADRPLGSLAEAVRSSERMQKVLRLSAAEPVLPGSMLLDRQGEVVGVFIGADTVGSSAVPFRAFSGAIGGVLKDKTVSRPYLGVNYLDLTDNRPGAMKGVLLAASADGKRPAVVPRSPAAKAGLRDGDVIVAVNDEDVTATNALADLLSEYGAGDTVTLSVERSGAGIKAEVTLGEAYAP